MAAHRGSGGDDDDDVLHVGHGPYRVVTADGAVVRFGERLGSFVVGTLKYGDVIEVVEVTRLDDQQTIRARIAQPPGWITAKRGLGGACLEPLRTSSLLVAAAAQPHRAAEAPASASAASAGSRHAAASAVSSLVPKRRPSAEQEVRDNLEELGLGCFFAAFVREGFDRIDAVRAMREEDMVKVGMKPGHIRLLQQRLALLEAFEASLGTAPIFQEAKERGGLEGELRAQVEDLIRQREEESQRAGQDFVDHLTTKQELDYTREQLASARTRLANLERPKTSSSQELDYTREQLASARTRLANLERPKTSSSQASPRFGEPLDDASVPGLEELIVY